LTIALPLWFAYLVTVLVCGAALWKGDWEERVVGGGLGLSCAVTVIARDLSWPRVQLAELGGDILMLALLFVVALRTKKFWPLFAAAFQLLAVMTHVAKTADSTLHQWAYVTAIVIWTYLIFIALGVGAWNAWRKRRRIAQAQVAE
jgi:hypothetical protein